jgi:hypothetical protein
MGESVVVVRTPECVGGLLYHPDTMIILGLVMERVCVILCSAMIESMGRQRQSSFAVCIGGEKPRHRPEERAIPRSSDNGDRVRSPRRAARQGQ